MQSQGSRTDLEVISLFLDLTFLGCPQILLQVVQKINVMVGFERRKDLDKKDKKEEKPTAKKIYNTEKKRFKLLRKDNSLSLHHTSPKGQAEVRA